MFLVAPLLRAPVLVGAVFLALAGCGGAPPVREPISPLYTALTDEFADFDFRVLRGKKILIDPGHGGRFTGTTGQDGLEEKSVNLGVSLYLWGLLTEAGAEASLTRAADRDFLVGEAESDLTRDLAARVAISDSLDPDLFLSVHHNARGDTNRAFNQIEVYYPMADDGPSRDAAYAIFHHLKRNLGEAKGRVIPGNFYVLRENDAPAVLGESSYLSHPPVEEKLKLSDIQRLEAEAYFLGVTRYFMSGAPRAWFVAERSGAEDDPEEETGRRFEPVSDPDTIRTIDDFHVQAIVRDEDGFAGIDPSTIELTLDGEPLTHRFLPGSDRVQAALPYEIANAPHELTLRARNLNGNSTKVARREVLVDLPVEDVGISMRVADETRLFSNGREFDSTMTTSFLSLSFRDTRGLPIRSQTARLTGLAGSPRGVNLLRDLENGRAVNFRLTHPWEGDLSVELEHSTIPLDMVAIRNAEVAPFAETREPFSAVWVGDRFFGFSDEFGNLTTDTEYRDPPAAAIGRSAKLDARESWRTSGIGSPRWVNQGSAWLRHLRESGQVSADYKERRVLIDPGAGESDGFFPDQEQTIAIARMLKEMLAYYGIRARLTHESLSAPPLNDRIALAREWNATFWITLETSAAYTITHFPTSRFGGPDSEVISLVLGDRLQQEVPVRTDTRRELRDTPCTAVVVSFPASDRNDRGDRARLRAIAHGLSESFVNFMIYTRKPERFTKRYTIPDCRAGDLIRIDDGITFQALADGPFHPWVTIDPGPVHEIWIQRDGRWIEQPVPDDWPDYWFLGVQSDR